MQGIKFGENISPPKQEIFSRLADNIGVNLDDFVKWLQEENQSQPIDGQRLEKFLRLKKELMTDTYIHLQAGLYGLVGLFIKVESKKNIYEQDGLLKMLQSIDIKSKPRQEIAKNIEKLVLEMIRLGIDPHNYLPNLMDRQSKKGMIDIDLALINLNIIKNLYYPLLSEKVRDFLDKIRSFNNY